MTVTTTTTAATNVGMAKLYGIECAVVEVGDAAKDGQGAVGPRSIASSQAIEHWLLVVVIFIGTYSTVLIIFVHRICYGINALIGAMQVNILHIWVLDINKFCFFYLYEDS